MTDDVPRKLRDHPRRWPGVLLSALVPGFGLVRAGHTARGVGWFLSIQAAAFFAALLAIWRSIPSWCVALAFAATLAMHLWMLIDSFRPGLLRLQGWIAFVVLLLIFGFVPPAARLVARPFMVPTRNMEPTLLCWTDIGSDHVIIDRISYRFTAPKRGDIVVFRTAGIPAYDADVLVVNRLVGLPGEKIEIRDGHVFANGRQLGEEDGIPRINYTTHADPSRTSTGTYQVPPDHFFTLGDNPRYSFDGRSWGFLAKGDVYGRVARTYSPFQRAGVPR